MQRIKPLTLEDGVLVGWGISVLLVSGLAGGGGAARRLAALGAKVVVLTGVRDALEQVLQGQICVDMLAIDCDSAGGIAEGYRAFGQLAGAGVSLPLLLMSAGCAEQTFPVGREAPIHLRAPVSAVALRIAFELAFASARDPCAPEKGRSRGGAPFRI